MLQTTNLQLIWNQTLHEQQQRTVVVFAVVGARKSLSPRLNVCAVCQSCASS